MLKEQLMKEAKEIKASVELDPIFAESETLSEQTKENFKAIFEEAVTKKAVELAESHIERIATEAEDLLETKLSESIEKHEKDLNETTEKYLDHISEVWLQENILEIQKGIKSDLFESMFTELKRVFVEHNVAIPEESVDVVAEMEDDLAESKAEAAVLFGQLTEMKTELNTIRKERLTEAKVQKLSESQKEKVYSLVESITFDDKFESKLDTIVKMAESKQTATVQKTEEQVATQQISEAEKLNFKQEHPHQNANMKAYLKY